MTDIKELNNNELRKVAGGRSIAGATEFNEVTKLLKDAGDRVWVLITYAKRDELFTYINKAEKMRISLISQRKTYINKALELLKKPRYTNKFSSEDYEFVKSKLMESDRRTNP